MSKTGHIPTPEGGAMDIYVGGERATFRDGYRDAAQVTHRDEDSVLSVLITGKERLGITNVSGEFWDDEEDAFQTDGDHVEFEHEHTEDDDIFVFKAVDDDFTVEIRPVGAESGGDAGE